MMIRPLCLVDGAVATSIDSRDRGLAFGDGLFETLKVTDNNVQLFTAHWQRFAEGCRRLRLPPPQQDEFKRDIKKLVTDGTYVIKWLYTRGSGGRGYNAPSEPMARRIVMRAGFDSVGYAKKAQEGISVRYSDMRLSRQPCLSGIKHLNRLENVLARMEWQDDTISESLMFDEDDTLIEGVFSNVFVYVHGCWWTPELERCGIAGVMRAVVLDTLHQQGIEARVGVIGRAMLEGAESLFMTNSLMPIWPVHRCQGRTLTIRQDVRRLQQAVAAHIATQGSLTL
ncbi:MAG: aminodeoxychorismate lyase [Alphaproteobacteria bacterium GM202ARS2]|nr:aminodeoxychorismate lyase [Alphaproteobacteria bacterium GM202ARS2]